jgi:protein translocase SecG subunit
MLTFCIYLFSIFLILDCLFLGLLILIQLPKKEAGVGVAFGGGAADALFGAGSGTALSNLTKYTATAFFILVFALAVMNNHARHSAASDLQRQLSKLPAIPTPAAQPAVTTPKAIAASNAASTNLIIPTSNVPATTTPATTQPEAPQK